MCVRTPLGGGRRLSVHGSNDGAASSRHGSRCRNARTLPLWPRRLCRGGPETRQRQRAGNRSTSGERVVAHRFGGSSLPSSSRQRVPSFATAAGETPGQRRPAALFTLAQVTRYARCARGSPASSSSGVTLAAWRDAFLSFEIKALSSSTNEDSGTLPVVTSGRRIHLTMKPLYRSIKDMRHN